MATGGEPHARPTWLVDVARSITLPRSFYKRDSRIVAPELLNKVFRYGELSGRIVEVEAYAGNEDPGSHAYKGQTPRNATMFGPPGHLYVYFTYGMYWCANAVCGDVGVGVAVLIRALAPLKGLDVMYKNRPKAKRDGDLCSGPGKLCQAFEITGLHNGTDLVRGGDGIRILDDGTPPPTKPGVGIRIGLSAGIESPWRWWIAGDPNVSR